MNSVLPTRLSRRSNEKIGLMGSHIDQTPRWQRIEDRRVASQSEQIIHSSDFVLRTKRKRKERFLSTRDFSRTSDRTTNWISVNDFARRISHETDLLDLKTNENDGRRVQHLRSLELKREVLAHRRRSSFFGRRTSTSLRSMIFKWYFWLIVLATVIGWIKTLYICSNERHSRRRTFYMNNTPSVHQSRRISNWSRDKDCQVDRKTTRDKKHRLIESHDSCLILTSKMFGRMSYWTSRTNCSMLKFGSTRQISVKLSLLSDCVNMAAKTSNFDSLLLRGSDRLTEFLGQFLGKRTSYSDERIVTFVVLRFQIEDFCWRQTKRENLSDESNWTTNCSDRNCCPWSSAIADTTASLCGEWSFAFHWNRQRQNDCSSTEMFLSVKTNVSGAKIFSFFTSVVSLRLRRTAGGR